MRMNLPDYASVESPSPHLKLGPDIIVERDVRVRVSDGVHISVDIFRPKSTPRCPALFAMAPYIKLFDDRPVFPTYRFRETLDIAWWVRRGYVYVHADTRGAGKSLEGDYEGWGAREQQDLYDVIEWTARQSWCDGNVGMIGYSYYGVCQWLAAAMNPPSLKCIAPYDASVDPYRDFFFHGGIWSMGFAQWWVPKFRKRVILDMPGDKPSDVMKFDFCDASFRHPRYDSFWRERDASERFDRIKVPVYSIGNWNMVGLHLRGNVLGYEQVNTPKKLMLCGGTGGIHASHYLVISREIHVELWRWYDYWLKGIDNGIMGEPPVKYVRRPDNRWFTAGAWPLPETKLEKLYLAPGKANAVTSLNDGRLDWLPPPQDGASTDYGYAHPDWGGWPGSGTTVMRADGTGDALRTIPTFTSEPLARDIEICGPIVMNIWISSDQSDTDFYVKLADQPPPDDPQSGSPRVGVTRGWLKATRRKLDPTRSEPHRPFHCHEEEEALVPGEVYALSIEVWPTSWLFKKGHRIRVEIAPGDSPLTDEPFWHDFGVRMGRDTVYHDAAHPSHIVLPVISRDASAD
jgi:uncharacterized protein